MNRLSSVLLLSLLTSAETGLYPFTGFEGTLCVSSCIDAQNVIMTHKTLLADKVIGSVKWPSLNSSQ